MAPSRLACSGARTATFTDSSGYFKPGLDFYDDGAGHQGQAKGLQAFATGHDVKLVVVSIGGNDFNFGSVVQQCVTDFLASPSWYPDYCKDDSSVTANFTSANVAAVRSRIATAFANVRQGSPGPASGRRGTPVPRAAAPAISGTGLLNGEPRMTLRRTSVPTKPALCRRCDVGTEPDSQVNLGICSPRFEYGYSAGLSSASLPATPRGVGP